MKYSNGSCTNNLRVIYVHVTQWVVKTCSDVSLIVVSFLRNPAQVVSMLIIGKSMIIWQLVEPVIPSSHIFFNYLVRAGQVSVSQLNAWYPVDQVWSILPALELLPSTCHAAVDTLLHSHLHVDTIRAAALNCPYFSKIVVVIVGKRVCVCAMIIIITTCIVIYTISLIANSGFSLKYCPELGGSIRPY